MLCHYSKWWVFEMAMQFNVLCTIKIFQYTHINHETIKINNLSLWYNNFYTSDENLYLANKVFKQIEHKEWACLSDYLICNLVLLSSI